MHNKIIEKNKEMIYYKSQNNDFFDMEGMQLQHRESLGLLLNRLFLNQGGLCNRAVALYTFRDK